jgi:hypothetical protein
MDVCKQFNPYCVMTDRKHRPILKQFSTLREATKYMYDLISELMVDRELSTTQQLYCKVRAYYGFSVILPGKECNDLYYIIKSDHFGWIPYESLSHLPYYYESVYGYVCRTSIIYSF